MSDALLPVTGPETVSFHTSDGVRLDADLYRPTGDVPYPVLLMRQPYGRRIACTICYAHPSWYAAHGFLVVIQDVRGRGSSEGRFRLFADDAQDGAETVAWAAGLPGSNGAVGMYGFSYQGTNQLLAASANVRQLKALAPAMIGWDLHNDWARENGAFCLRAGLGWAVQMAAEDARLAGDTEAFNALHRASRALPLNDPIPARPELIDRYRTYSHYFDWLDQPADADYWRAISPHINAATLADAGPPALFIGGWYDSHLPGTLAAYRDLARRGRTDCRLVVGPWSHFPWGSRVGSEDFGTAAIGEIDQLQVRWFKHWLQPEAGAFDQPPVRLFDMGTRNWRDFGSWPTQSLGFHLGSEGRAAIDPRAGKLLVEPPARPIVEYLVHDPWRPVATVGGPFGAPPGPADRGDIDGRPDVLTFTSEEMTETLQIAGSVSAELAVESDAVSFDLSCVLSCVDESGWSINIAEGYCTVPAPSPAPITIPMRASCYRLRPGERLRLSIAAASFPAYPVNPGSGADPTRTGPQDARIITLRLACDGRSKLVVGLSP